MQTNEKVYHPETGEELFRDVRRIGYEYHGIKFYADMPGWYPKDNDDGIFTKEDMKVVNETKKILPDKIKQTRKKLKLTQEAAGALLGGGHRAFQKYESGEILPSRAISNLLKLLWQKPDMLELLKA